jgi:hypothetical protein
MRWGMDSAVSFLGLNGTETKEELELFVRASAGKQW